MMRLMKARKRSPSVTDDSPTQRSAGNRLRIIGGRWRGTRLQFPDVAAIRPTPDRVRETLYNWLQQTIVGARCLDLFAGSGALGFEALSRGASEVIFVDREPTIGRYLRETLQRLDCTNAQVFNADALAFFKHNSGVMSRPFDVVFLDPPFALSASNGAGDDLLPQLFEQLENKGWLATHAWIYFECPASVEPLALRCWPSAWRLHRSKRAGQVGYHLAQRTTPTTA